MTQQPSQTPESGEHNVCFALNQGDFDDLAGAAKGRDMEPAELVGRWVRERLAHERERSLGRERPQRPQRD